MQFARWYGSAVQLGNGQILLIGGRDDSPATDIHYSAYAEIYTPGYGFHTLTGAYIDSFNLGALYPRSWLTPSGKVWTSDGTGNIYSIDPTGVGSVQLIGQMPTAISWSDAVDHVCCRQGAADRRRRQRLDHGPQRAHPGLSEDGQQ